MVTRKDDLITIQLPLNGYKVYAQDLYVTQWNKGQKLAILGVTDGTEVQFGNDLVETTLNRSVTDGVVEIPDIMLTYAEPIKAYVQVITANSETTRYEILIRVEERTKPGDYIEPEDEQSFREYMEHIMLETKDIAENKQDKLEAGDGIKIEDNVISATGGAGGGDGKSAYEVAVENGFKGTEEEWLASLVGPQGESGKDGETPIKGIDYFTEDEIEKIEQNAANKVISNIIEEKTNLLDTSTITTGKYWNGVNQATNANYALYATAPIDASKTYTITNKSLDLKHTYFVKENGNQGGLLSTYTVNADGSLTFTPPTDVVAINITCSSATDIYEMMMFEGTEVPLYYVEYGKVLNHITDCDLNELHQFAIETNARLGALESYGEIEIPYSEYDCSIFISNSASGVQKKYRGIDIPNGSTTSTSCFIGVIPTVGYTEAEEGTTLYYKMRFECNMAINKVLQGYTSYVDLGNNQYDVYVNKAGGVSLTSVNRRIYCPLKALTASEDISLRLLSVYCIPTTQSIYEYAKRTYEKTIANGEKITVTVNTTDTSEFKIYYTDLVDICHSITDSNEKKEYDIKILSGEYELYDLLDLTDIQDQVPYKRGLEVPNFVNLIGIGNVTIKCTLPETETSVHVQAISTLNFNNSNNVIKNITIEATNCRYCVHDDAYNMTYGTIIFEDVKMKHNGNTIGAWPSTECYGAGYATGRHGTFKNCVFESAFLPFYIHNINAPKDKIYVELENCIFKTTHDYAVRLNSAYETDVRNRVTINNSYLEKPLQLDGKENAFEIFGGGNNEFEVNDLINTDFYLIENHEMTQNS